MPDLTDEMHRRVLNEVEGTLNTVLTARNSERLPTGYQNFNLALTTLSWCRHSIEQVRERKRIVAILREASQRLGLWESGRSEPAMRSTRHAIDEIVADLELTPVV